jgi:hypothetical protein
MGYILWAFVFLIAGFCMESCICFYHRSRENNKFLQASLLSGVISLIGILVVSRVVFSVVAGPLGHLALIYVPLFAFGKGAGTYASLTLWDKLYPKKTRC